MKTLLRTMLLQSIFLMMLFLLGGCQNTDDERNGLVGVFFNRADLSNPKQYSVITTLEQYWGSEKGFANEWSGYWEGYVIAPDDGVITFYLSTDKRARLQVLDQEIEGKHNDIRDSISISVKQGEMYPIKITYLHEEGGEGYFYVQWSIHGGNRESIAPENLYYDSSNEENWIWLKEPGENQIDRRQFGTVPVEHVLVYHKPGYFNAWPANNGIWIWENEILVGFAQGDFKFDVLKHSFDRSKPMMYLLARSLDGGETWSVEDPDNFVEDGEQPVPLLIPVNFTHPDFAMRINRTEFYYSYDRGKTWNGPFIFPAEDGQELTSRTDYLVNGDNDGLFFLSLVDERVRSGLPDRAFAARTMDGGKSINFLSWMTETDTIRSVMTSTVRIEGDHLVSAMRRRYDIPDAEKSAPQINWIDVYQSFDNGNSWSFLSKVADTDRGTRNGNPPSLIKLNDGRLCVTYAFRGVPYSIRARISPDNGRTWGKEIILRENVLPPDIGYTRSVQRSDGNVVTLYYLATEERNEEHIEAAIWDPAKIK